MTKQKTIISTQVSLTGEFGRAENSASGRTRSTATVTNSIESVVMERELDVPGSCKHETAIDAHVMYYGHDAAELSNLGLDTSMR